MSSIIYFFLTLNNFCFDTDWKTELLASNYLESLKIAASKVKNQFAVDKTKFSSYEFWELVSAAKGVKELHFQYDKILLDESADFGDMEGSNIECLGFYWSGGSNYSNWKEHPIRFENIIAGISKSKGLKGSLKRLYIHSCEITNDKAQEVLNKYELHEVMLEGV